VTRPLPPIGAPRGLPGLPVHTRILGNGLPLTVVERRDLPIVHLEIILRAGADLDQPAQAGRTSLMAEMLDEGTASRSALDIAEQLDHLGAWFSITPSWDATVLSLHVLSQRLEAALDIVADVVLNASFPADEFRRKQDERLAALQQDRDEAAELAAKALAAGVFGAAHPYGAPIDGTHDSVSRLTRDVVAALYAERAGPAHAHMLVVGDVSADAIAAAVAARFGAWSGGAPVAAALPAGPLAAGRRVLLVDKPDAAQAEVRVGHAAPARDTQDFFALKVLNTVLGGSFTSRLNTILRERMGVTYGASSSFRLRSQGGIFQAGAAILTEAAVRSAQVMVEEMQKLQNEHVPADELRRAQSYIALGLPRSFESAENIAAHVREQIVHGLAPDYWAHYVERVSAVSAQDVAAAATRHLHPDACTIVIVADRKAVTQSLEQTGLGEVLPTNVVT
jgi:zinc protease